MVCSSPVNSRALRAFAAGLLLAALLSGPRPAFAEGNPNPNPAGLPTVTPSGVQAGPDATIKTVDRQTPDGIQRIAQIDANTRGADSGGSTSGGGGTGGCVTTVTGEQLTEQVPLPVIKIEASPDSFGISNAPSAFWASGYNGGRPTTTPMRGYRYLTTTCTDPITHVTTSSPPVPVPVIIDVTIWPENYSWKFGDNTTDDKIFDCHSRNNPADCNDPHFLGASHSTDIAHRYDVASMIAGKPSGYTVQFLVNFFVQLTIDGVATGVYEIPGVPYTRDYQVGQVESLLTH